MMKPIVIAGNGPSLKEIDYRRLPKEYDVFRCNQFFFEDKYYLGNTVTGYFFGVSTIESLYATSVFLQERKEYFFQDRYFSSVELDKRYFFTVKSAYDICKEYPKIAHFVADYGIAYFLYPTAGILMILTAISLGYTDIYITGIDFYKSKDLYAFSIEDAPVLNNTVRNINKPYLFDTNHTEEMEYKYIELIKSLTGINIYAISPDSALSALFTLAPIQNDTPYTPTKKPENYIKDIILSKRQEQIAQKGIKQKIKNIFIKKDLVGEWEFISQNSLVRFTYQTIKLPYIMMRIIIKLIK